MPAPRFSIVVLQDGDSERTRPRPPHRSTRRFRDREIVTCARPSDPSSPREKPSHRRAVSSSSSSTRPTCSTATRSPTLLRTSPPRPISSTPTKIPSPGPIRSAPFYKPDWSPERLLNQHYLGRVCASGPAWCTVGESGRRRRAAWEYDLALRVSEHARRIDHVPEALYHRAGGGDEHASAPRRRPVRRRRSSASHRSAAPHGSNHTDPVIRLRPRSAPQPSRGHRHSHRRNRTASRAEVVSARGQLRPERRRALLVRELRAHLRVRRLDRTGDAPRRSNGSPVTVSAS